MGFKFVSWLDWSHVSAIRKSSLFAIFIVDLAMSTLICSYISDYRKIAIDWIAIPHALMYWHEVTLRVSIVSSHLACILKQAVWLARFDIILRICL